jgi:hypothetical protein
MYGGYDMGKDSKEYERLLSQFDKLLNGHKYDDVIPATALMLAVAAYRSRAEKRLVLAFVAETLDNIYSLAEKENI